MIPSITFSFSRLILAHSPVEVAGAHA